MEIIKFINVIVKMFIDIYVCLSGIVNIPYKLIGIIIGIPAFLLPLFILFAKFIVKKIKHLVN